MGFIYEKVKEEDWELYNSFLPNYETADEFTRWVVDKERNIYFFWIGIEARENIYEYLLLWNDLKKIYIQKQKCIKNLQVNKRHIYGLNKSQCLKY